MSPDPRLALTALFREEVERWWSSDVPILFPSYVAARLATHRAAPVIRGLALALATFPAVAVLSGLTAVREHHLTAAHFEQLWVWANLENPALASLPVRLIAAQYLAVCATGLLAGLPAVRRRGPVPDSTDLARVAGDAMNWSAVLLGAMLCLALFAQVVPGPTWLLAFEPLSAPHAPGALQAGMLASNGALFLGPELWLAARARLSWTRLLAWRLLAGALAALFACALSAV